MSRTIAYVKEKLELLGVETRFSEDSGLVGIIRGQKSSPCIFEIGIEGKGGHAAEPRKCTDPILVMNRIYTEIQSIQRSLLSPKDKAVISITSVQ